MKRGRSYRGLHNYQPSGIYYRPAANALKPPSLHLLPPSFHFLCGFRGAARAAQVHYHGWAWFGAWGLGRPVNVCLLSLGVARGALRLLGPVVVVGLEGYLSYNLRPSLRLARAFLHRMPTTLLTAVPLAGDHP
eukprot:scaffold199232_cov40-Tisochrysis_lutea.AAC.1